MVQNKRMQKLDVHVRSKKSAQETQYTIKIDAKKFERLASAFGFFNSDFIKSIERAEKDVRTGRMKKLKSFKDLD